MKEWWMTVKTTAFVASGQKVASATVLVMAWQRSANFSSLEKNVLIIGTIWPKKD